MLNLKTIDDIAEEGGRECLQYVKVGLHGTTREEHSGPTSLLRELLGGKGGEEAKSEGDTVTVAYVTSACSPVVSRKGSKPLVVMVRADTDPITLDDIFQTYINMGLASIRAMDLSPPAGLPPTSETYKVAIKHELPLGGGGMRQKPYAVYELLKTAVEKEGAREFLQALCLAGCRNPEEPCTKLMDKAKTLARATQEILQKMAPRGSGALGLDRRANFYAQFPACLKVGITPEWLWDLGEADRVFLLHSLSGTGAGLAVWLLDEHRLPEGCSCNIMYTGRGKVRDIIDVAIAPASEEVEDFPHLPKSVEWSMSNLARYLNGDKLRGNRLTLFIVDLDIATGHALLNLMAEKLSTDEFFSSRELREVNRLLSSILNTGIDIGVRLRNLHSYAISKGITHRDADIHIAGSLHPLLAIEWRKVEILASNKRIDYSEAVGYFLHGLIIPSYTPGPVASKYIDKAADLREDVETAITLLVAHGLLAPFSRRRDVGVEGVALFLSEGLLRRINERFGKSLDREAVKENLRDLFNKDSLEVKFFKVYDIPGQPSEFGEALWAYVMVFNPVLYKDFLLSKYPGNLREWDEVK
jgi:hypothetical protein